MIKFIKSDTDLFLIADWISLFQESGPSQDPRMASFQERLGQYESVANVRIVCQDGVLLSHKIVVVVAVKNSFLKALFSDIPVGDTITLFMPDYKQEEVKQSLSLVKVELKEQEDEEGKESYLTNVFSGEMDVDNTKVAKKRKKRNSKLENLEVKRRKKEVKTENDDKQKLTNTKSLATMGAGN